MNNVNLYQRINDLPTDLQKEVGDFVEFLHSKIDRSKDQKNEREFGILKSKIKMAKDFDEPLSDFKEYM